MSRYIICAIMLLNMFGSLSACTSIADHQSFKLAKDFMEIEHLAGLSITIGNSERIIQQISLGYSDLESHKLVKENTIFQIASVSKFISAVAVLKLHESGKIKELNEPIQKYLQPVLQHKTPKSFSAITIDNLLTHTSGIRHYAPNKYELEKRYAGPNLARPEAAAMYGIIFEPLLFKPGTQYHYSTFAINLLQDVIEQASGEELPNLLNELFWKPFALKNTGLTYGDHAIKMTSVPYEWINAEHLRAVDVNSQWKSTGGGLLSTSSELYKFISALTSGQILNGQTYHYFMTANPYNVRYSDYGRGVHVYLNESEHKWLGHGGSATGGTAFVLFRSDGQLILTALANTAIPSRKLGSLLSKLSAYRQIDMPTIEALEGRI